MLGKFIARGRTAEVYHWGEEYVLKLFYDFIPREAVTKEYNKTLNICKNNRLCPSPIEMISYDSKDGIVYENVKGKSLTTLLLNDFKGVKKVGELLANTHLLIHQNRCDELESVKESIERTIKSSLKLDEYKKNEILEILRDLPDDNVLCHMDYHTDNVFYDGASINVIDWMTAGRGSPLADIARTIVILRYAVLPFQNPIFKIFIKLFRERLIKEYMNFYFSKSSLKKDNLEKWIKVIAASRINERLPEGEIGKLMKII